MRTASQLSIPQMPNFHVFHNCPKSYVDVTFSDWNSLWKVGAFATRFIAILCKLRKMQHLYILDILCRILGLLCMQSTKIRPRMGETRLQLCLSHSMLGIMDECHHILMFVTNRTNVVSVWTLCFWQRSNTRNCVDWYKSFTKNLCKYVFYSCFVLFHLSNLCIW